MVSSLFNFAWGQLVGTNNSSNISNSGPLVELQDNHIQHYMDSCYESVEVAEIKTRIPRYMLQAISLLEAGRHFSGAQRSWPWTISVNDKRHFYKSKQEALSALNAFIGHGFEDVYVGCMQLNYKFHAAAFFSVSEMLEPVENVAYAASFLLHLKEKHNTWSAALSTYRSNHAFLGEGYYEAVMAKIAELNKDYSKDFKAKNQAKIELLHNKQTAENERKRQEKEARLLEYAKNQKRLKEIGANDWGDSSYKKQKQEEMGALSRVLSSPSITIKSEYKGVSDGGASTNDEFVEEHFVPTEIETTPLPQRKLPEKPEVAHDYAKSRQSKGASSNDWLLQKLYN